MPTLELAEVVVTSAQRRQKEHGYRPDVDGLRAIAIISVVGFHAGIRAFHGGFVGVDIFFVISGYLIGGIVYRETTSKTFTFAKFYRRRAKRILPAFFTVLLVCYVIALLVLSPAELRQFSGTALAAIFSASNVQLWLTTGYFTNGAQFNPLLMTWSLAVEEQFYILFPIAMLAAVSLKRHLVAHIVAICSMLSFLLSVWGVSYHPTMAFFLLPTRAWEIGAGVLLAISVYERRSSDRASGNRATHVLGALGAALIIYSILVCRSTQFPGVAALLPVVGTLLLIGQRNSFVGRALSARPAVFVGKLSYSWYLWHWPMLSFARIVSDRPLALGVTLSIAGLSFFAAIASFYLVEQPLRRSSTHARPMLIRYATLLLIISTIPLFLLVKKGLPHRRAQLAEMEEQGRNVTNDVCLAAYGKTSPRLTRECISLANDRHIVALIGDSHAGTLAETLRSLAVKSGYDFDEIGKSSCPPLHNVTSYMPNHPGHDRECAEFNLKTLNYICSNPRIELVIIAGYWSAPFSQREENFGYVLASGNHMGVSRYVPLPPHHTGVSYDASRENFQYGLEGEVEQLRAAGKRIILIKDAPEFDFNPVRYEIARFIPMRLNVGKIISSASGVVLQKASGRAPAYDDHEQRAIIDAIGARYSDLNIYDLKKNLCEDGECTFLSHGSLLYIDPNHLSRTGAEKALANLDLNGIDIEQESLALKSSTVSNARQATGPSAGRTNTGPL
jgi:peptidoglycan/LPS O-acetylase OafA/YrhL